MSIQIPDADKANRLLIKWAKAESNAGNGNIRFYDCETGSVVSNTVGKSQRVMQAMVLTAASASTMCFQTYSATGAAISPVYSLTANAGFVLPYSEIGWAPTSSGHYLSLSASQGLSALIAYGEQG